MRVSELRVVALVALWAAAPCALAAQVRESTALGIDDSDRVVLRRNVHRLARPEFDQGRSAPSLPMERMILHLSRRAGGEQELSRLLGDQQNPASPEYHRWLTPQEFGERFGPTSADLRLATDWLQDRGFRVDEVANGRGWINFSGTAEQVEAAFATEIHDYRVAGVLRHANATDPSIPRGLARVVGGIVSLNSFPRQPQNGGVRRIAAEPTPDFNSGGSHYLAPADFATIYNLNPVYGAGYDGTGRTIAIVGRTEIRLADVRFFRSFFGLPAKDPLFVFNGTHPGIVNPNEEIEGDLDVQWAGAVAPGATVKFVISKSTFTSDGVDLSAQYIVDNNLADVMSTSFGQCEVTIGATGLAFYANLWAQAAAQGITSFVSSGDSGAAGCNGGGDPVGTGTGVNGLCSTPNNVCVGGGQFDEGSGSYWSGTNDPDTKGSALSYIPEIAWNESGNVGGTGLWSTGGGVSTVHAKPAWQAGPGVPADGKRDVPDVSLSAAIHDAYVVASEDATGTTGLFAVGGTSASSPSFAGLMALVVQRTGQRQGNANPTLYQLGAAQYGGGGAAVFHDVTSGDNSVPGVAGFSAGPGYDLVTGLGTVDGFALVNAFLSLPKLSVGDVTVTEGTAGVTSAVFQVTLSDTSAASVTVHFATANGTATSESGDYATTSGTLTFAPGQTTQTLSVPVNGDTLFELDETFFVNLDSPAGAVIEDGQGKGTIQNDDAFPSLSIGNSSVTEGNSGLKNATFVVTLSTVSGAPATVAFATQDGTATAAGGDYVPRTGTLTIPAGQPSGMINVQVKGDAVVEPNETFFVNLSSPGNATVAVSQGQGTILNDDSPGQFQFGAAAFTVSEAAGVATITVRRINGNSAGATVHYATFDGTASGAGNQDYTPQSGTLTFGANQSLATFKVPIAKDFVHEPNETVLLRLDDPQPASLGAGLAPQRTAILTIVDNDAGGKIQLAAAAYSVNAVAADGSVKLVVRRTGGLASPATVHFSLTDGTALEGVDYQKPLGDVVTFVSSGPGASMQTITVPVNKNLGGAKRFSLSLSAPTGGAVLGTIPTATVTILGAQPTLGFAGPAFTVKTTQPAALITVKRSAPLTGTVTVKYDASGGSAMAGTDYTPAAGTLTFGPNVAARTFMVAIAKNPFVSGPKDVHLTLTTPTWTLGTAVLDPALGSSLLTIQNPNAVPAVQFSTGVYTVSEPTLKALITVKRTGDPAGTVTVGYSAGGGTAVNGDPSVDPAADYTLAPGTLTFGPNVMVRTFTIPIVNDLVDEGTETAVLSLDTPTWTGGTAVLGPLGSATLRITDNEPTVQFAAAAYSVAEAAKSLTIAVRRTGSLASPATVHYDATGGTAVRDIGAGGDYALAAGDLTFGPGQSVKTFVVTLKPDTAADGPRTIDLGLTLPSGAQLGTPSTTVVTIRDDDLAGKAQFSAAGYSVAEGAGTATITVTRTGGAASATTVQYSVVAGAARPAAPADFDPTSGTLTFGPGEKSKTFSVTVHDDGVPDGGAVSLDLTLDTPGGGLALGSPSTATLWIVRE